MEKNQTQSQNGVGGESGLLSDRKPSKGKLIGVLLAVVVLIATGIGIWLYFSAPGEERVRQSSSEQKESALQSVRLATVPEGYQVLPGTIFFRENGKQVVFAASKSSDETDIFVNDTQIGTYTDTIHHVNADHLIFEGKRGEERFLIIDGQEYGPYIYDKLANLRFTPDGKHFTFTALKREFGVGGQSVVVDDAQGEFYDDVSSAVFSPDGTRYAYVGLDRDEQKRFVVLDGQVVGSYLDAFSPTFSPDSKRFVYAVREAPEYFAILDGKEGKRYRQISSIVFSSDSEHIKYMARKGFGGTWSLVIDESETESYDYDHIFPLDWNIYQAQREKEGGGADYFMILDDNNEIGPFDILGFPVFSADNKHFAFKKHSGNQVFVTTDQTEYGPYDDVESIVFSSDSQRVAFVARKGQEYFVVLDGQEGDAQSVRISSLAFSPDSKHLAYVAQKGFADAEAFVVLDGQEGGRYNGVSTPIFSSDSQHLAYFARKGTALEAALGQAEFSVILDGKELKSYSGVYQPTFSEDSKYISYGAKDGNGLWWIVEEVN